MDAPQRRTADEANRRLAAIVTSSNDAIIGETLDGIVTDWNRGGGNPVRLQRGRDDRQESVGAAAAGSRG